MDNQPKNAQPKAITLDVATSMLEVTWGDEHVSRYNGAYLRHACPCADCRGHSPGEKEPPPWEQVKDVRVTHVEAVGTYALRFTLSDGHSTGIYTYDYLRGICPTGRQQDAQPGD